MWTIEEKLQKMMNCSKSVSKNLVRLLDKEENTPTFVSRYRKNETSNMGPEEVFDSAKAIKELKEIQKKQKSLLTNLEKEKKLTPEIQNEIQSIDNLDDLNETISIFKTAKTSLVAKATEAGADGALAEILEMSRFGSVDLKKMRSEFKSSNKNFLKYISLVAIPKLLPGVAQRLSLDTTNIMCKTTKSKSKANPAENKEKYSNYFDFSRTLRDVADHQYLAIMRGEKNKALSTSFTIVGPNWARRNTTVGNVIGEVFGKAILQERSLTKSLIDNTVDKFQSMELRRLKALRKKAAEDGSCAVFRSNLKARAGRCSFCLPEVFRLKMIMMLRTATWGESQAIA